MKQSTKPKFTWSDITGKATCIIYTDHGKFIGEAKCHPDDMDMISKMVGQEIAYERAIIKMLQYEKNNQIKPALKALRQLWFSMNRSKKFNPKSYETKMLKRQIKNWEFDLNLIQEVIDNRKSYIKKYIDTKDSFYKILREKRKKRERAK